MRCSKCIVRALSQNRCLSQAAAGFRDRRAGGEQRAPEPAERGPDLRLHAGAHRLSHDAAGPGGVGRAACALPSALFRSYAAQHAAVSAAEDAS